VARRKQNSLNPAADGRSPPTAEKCVKTALSYPKPTDTAAASAEHKSSSARVVLLRTQGQIGLVHIARCRTKTHPPLRSGLDLAAETRRSFRSSCVSGVPHLAVPKIVPPRPGRRCSFTCRTVHHGRLGSLRVRLLGHRSSREFDYGDPKTHKRHFKTAWPSFRLSDRVVPRSP
jgi:hypothetical protein